jgi:hypothetical protein
LMRTMMVTCRTFGHDELDIEDGGERKKPEKNLWRVCWNEAWLASKIGSIVMQRS